MCNSMLGGIKTHVEDLDYSIKANTRASQASRGFQPILDREKEAVATLTSA